MPLTRAEVEAALAREAAKFDVKYGGTHRFTPVWRADERPGCKWTANYHVTGSSVEVSEMCATLRRVQAKMPLVTFENDKGDRRSTPRRVV